MLLPKLVASGFLGALLLCRKWKMGCGGARPREVVVSQTTPPRPLQAHTCTAGPAL